MENPSVTQAEIELKQAQARQALAEERAALELAEKTRNEASRESINAALAQLKLDEAKELRRNELAADYHHNIYRFAMDVSSTSVKDCMSELSLWDRTKPRDEEFEIIFSSPGGSVIDGLRLYDFLLDLRRNGRKIVTGMHGYAASMAGILLQAGTHRWTGSQAWYLIHEPSFGAMGSLGEVEDRYKWIKAVNERVIDIFTERSTLTREEIAHNYERKDWWVSPEDALEFGLVDEIRGVDLVTR